MKVAVGKLARAALAWIRGSRALRLAVILAAIDLLLGWGFSWMSGSRGLVSPGGSVRADVAVLGAAYILARIAARFAVPALVAGAIAAALTERVARSIGRARRSNA